MHASDSLYDHLVKNLPSVHLSRIKSVFMAVDSLLKGGQLSLTAGEFDYHSLIPIFALKSHL